MRDLKDSFGVEVEVGDTIIYALRRGSSHWINQAVVEEIVDNPNLRGTYAKNNLKVRVTKSGGWHNPNRKTTLRNPTFAIINRLPRLKLPEIKEE